MAKNDPKIFCFDFTTKTSHYFWLETFCPDRMPGNPWFSNYRPKGGPVQKRALFFQNCVIRFVLIGGLKWPKMKQLMDFYILRKLHAQKRCGSQAMAT